MFRCDKWLRTKTHAELQTLLFILSCYCEQGWIWWKYNLHVKLKFAVTCCGNYIILMCWNGTQQYKITFSVSCVVLYFESVKANGSAAVSPPAYVMMQHFKRSENVGLFWVTPYVSRIFKRLSMLQRNLNRKIWSLFALLISFPVTSNLADLVKPCTPTHKVRSQGLFLSCTLIPL